MKIAVLAVTHDGERPERLAACLRSIQDQTLQADEIILVLDGYVRDDLRAVIEEWESTLPIRTIESVKQGVSGCRNLALMHTTADVAIVADTDDVSLPKRFEVQAEALGRPNVVVTSAPIIERRGDGSQLIRSVPPGWIRKHSLYSFFRNPVNHNCAAFRVSEVRALGGYPSGRMEDYRLWIRCLIHGKTIFNTTQTLLLADAQDLSARRVGWDYFEAEVALLKMNAMRLWYVGALVALGAFLTRAPFRFRWARWMNDLAYRHFLRRRVGGA